MKKVIFLILSCFFVINSYAQVQDTIGVVDSTALVLTDSIDSKKKKRKREFKEGYPNAKKAVLFSIIPGGGQIYNGKWWKVPFVYGAFGGLIYGIDYNQNRYRRLRDALNLKRQDEPHEFSGTSLDSEQTLMSLRDQFDKNTQSFYIYTILAYFLQSMEAFVDAHLQNFDVEDDLGFRIKPQTEMNTALGQPVLGLGISIPFNNKKEIVPTDFLTGK